MRDRVLCWLRDNPYIEELKDYIRLPSRSTNREEVKTCGQMAIHLLNSCGLAVKSISTTGNDVILAETIGGEGKPTVLLYGHYDVQPEGSLDEWDTDPFEPVVRNGKLFGRGTADNKGQHFAYILALRYLREQNSELFEKVNIKIILDGDEELGSFSLPEMVRNHSSDLVCDFVLVSDGPSLSTDAPSIVCSVRGILDFQLIIKHNQTDLHSGNFGGVARSAARDLINIIESMVDPNGRVKINKFYDMVKDPLEQEKDALKVLSDVYESIVQEYRIDLAPMHSSMTNAELNQLHPTLNVNGLRSGGVRKKRRTIIPSEAIASIDCRLVPNQDPDHIRSLIEAHVSDLAEKMGISDSVSLEFGHAMNPMESSINSSAMKIVKEAAYKGFGVEPRIVPRLGGSLPIYLFSMYLNRPVLILPLSLPDSRNHAPNENLDLNFFKSGVATIVALLQKMSDEVYP